MCYSWINGKEYRASCDLAVSRKQRFRDWWNGRPQYKLKFGDEEKSEVGISTENQFVGQVYKVCVEEQRAVEICQQDIISDTNFTEWEKGSWKWA